jgi:hypothetical protein
MIVQVILTKEEYNKWKIKYNRWKINSILFNLDLKLTICLLQEKESQLQIKNSEILLEK